MIDDAQIQHLEKLARIRLDPAQRDAFREEIGRILAYMESLAAIDSLPAAAPAQAGAGMAGCRPDEVQPSLQRADWLAMSPQATEEYLTVPLAVT